MEISGIKYQQNTHLESNDDYITLINSGLPSLCSNFFVSISKDIIVTLKLN